MRFFQAGIRTKDSNWRVMRNHSSQPGLRHIATSPEGYRSTGCKRPCQHCSRCFYPPGLPIFQLAPFQRPNDQFICLAGRGLTLFHEMKYEPNSCGEMGSLCSNGIMAGQTDFMRRSVMLKGCGFHAASPRGSRKGVIFMSVRVEGEKEGGKIGTVTREKLTTALLPRRKDRLIGWTVATLQMRFRRQRQDIQQV